jgi:glycosyltransferase involved in cell wall biosynthesis
MKASIIIINYNDKLRVRRAIECAINQTHKDTEVILVDDGSDKETREIYTDYLDRITLIQLQRDDESARTPSRARNAGYKACTGEYVCFLDSDNYYEVDFIEKMIKEQYPIAMCNWEIIGLEKYPVNIENVWKPQEMDLNNYLMSQHLDHQCLLVKKSVLNEILLDDGELYDYRLPRSQDCDLIVRLMLLLNGDMPRYRFMLVPFNLFKFEKHENDQTKTLASIHGKTLWTLRNNLNIAWLSPLLNNAGSMLSYLRAITDFKTLPEWKKDYDKSGFKEISEQHERELNLERKEKHAIPKNS